MYSHGILYTYIHKTCVSVSIKLERVSGAKYKENTFRSNGKLIQFQ